MRLFSKRPELKWYQVKHNGNIVGTIEAEHGFDAIKAFKQPNDTGSWNAKETKRPSILSGLFKSILNG